MFPVNDNRAGLFVFSLAIFLAALWPASGFALTEISNVRHWTAPDQTRIVFDLSDEPVYQFDIQKNKVTLEFSNAFFSPSLPPEKIIRKPGVTNILFIRGEENKICSYKHDNPKQERRENKSFIFNPCSHK